MSISTDVIRTNKKYRLTNHGDIIEFEVIDITQNNDFIIKDIHISEIYHLSEFLQYGKGKDYNLEELDGL